MTTPSEVQTTPSIEATTQDAELRALETAALAEVALPTDAHVIGEPVIVTQIRYPELPRVGLMATCRRGDHTYEVNLADIVFLPGSAGASLTKRYRKWLGLAPSVGVTSELAKAHKVGTDDITVGEPVELVVLACKSNALRCRLLGSARELTLRTAVRDEIPGSIITVTPRKLWTHARHPYLSGEVSAVRIDARVLGLVPLPLHREGEAHTETAACSDAGRGLFEYRLEQVVPAASTAMGSDLIFEAQERIDAGEYTAADELLAAVLALDLRCLAAHAMLGTRALSHWPSLALHHFELGVAIGSLTVAEQFDGMLPWGLTDNRPFLRCLHGMAHALVRVGGRDAAAECFRRLLRLDPTDPLSTRASLAALAAGKTWREMEYEL